MCVCCFTVLYYYADVYSRGVWCRASTYYVERVFFFFYYVERVLLPLFFVGCIFCNEGWICAIFCVWLLHKKNGAHVKMNSA